MALPSHLPIHDILEKIKASLAQESVVILQAPPGAGKSTILPIALLDENWLGGQKILMLEPRRLAARAVATRMADLIGEEVGQKVGYRVRFESKVSVKTQLEVLTEGLLTRLIQQDNMLEGIGLVIFDEFHERSLHADLALALCREVQQVLRPDLKILIMSATLDTKLLSGLMGNAPVLISEGREHPIQYIYTDVDKHAHISVNVAAVVKRAVQEQDGDILVFLPGAGEILRTYEILSTSLSPDITIHPLYGDLSPAEQQKAILPNPQGRRKVVLATSIAETSLTIEGLKVVVDSGYARVPSFDPRSGLSQLLTQRVTRDAADQRAGRAGRLGPGVCYRLWHAAIQEQLEAHRKPEILEADLAPMQLELARWGQMDMKNMAWLTLPPAGALAQARDLLLNLDAIESDGKITRRGKEMLAFPTHPRLAHMLLEAQEAGLSTLAVDVIALLEERDPLDKSKGADLCLRLEALRRWRSSNGRGNFDRIEKLSLYWRKVLKTTLDTSIIIPTQVGRLIAAAYPERIAKRQENSERFRLANGRMARLPEYDHLAHEEWLAVANVDASGNEGKIFLAAPFDVADIAHLAITKEVLTWDTQKGQLQSREEQRVGDLIVSSKPLPVVDSPLKTEVLLNVVKTEGLKLFNWDENALQWQARLACLHIWRPEEEWPDVSNEALLASVEDWLAPFLTDVKRREDFAKLDLLMMLNTVLSWEQSQKLDKLVPAKITVPSGSAITIEYKQEGSLPVLAVRLQEMFGLVDTPAINEGRTALLLHLLSPGYKPVQVTQDLKSFWGNTYPDVRKELRVRYQKHHWPEDPWTAEAVRGAKKRIV